MTATLSEFRQRAKTAIEDIRLQGALDGGTHIIAVVRHTEHG